MNRISFKKFLQLRESLNKSLSYEWSPMRLSDVKTAQFKIGEFIYKVSFVLEEGFGSMSGKKIADVSFTATGESGATYAGIINSSNEFKVFSTVIAIIKEYIKDHNIDVLTFIAYEKSRIKLYLRLTKYFARNSTVKRHAYDGGELFYVFL